ncbi:MAG: hypothetical protein ACRD16_14110 [Thermoanaerobaculia bacterium]
MKKILALGISLALASVAIAGPKEVNGHWVNEHPSKNNPELNSGKGAPAKGGRVTLLTYQGGEVLYAAKVVPIYWGAYWGSGTGATERATMNGFYQQFGTNSHYGVITQYYDTVTGGTRYIGLSTLLNSGGDWYDSSAPPKNVTDSVVQGEVNKYLSSHTFDNEAIYEVFIPPTSYSSDGSSTSCGGPKLAYCAYHGSYSSGGHSIKYSIEPYPNCSGCQATGFSAVQNAQHFACHETREAVTDPVNAWWDTRTGYEADDKCAWSPAPFVDGGYGYQYEWSNAAKGCVK